MKNTAKVLVVDDDKALQLLLRTSLKAEHCGVVTATSGEECLEALKKDKKKAIKLVFLDLKMDGMDGEETLKQIKEGYKDVAVFMISSYATAKDKLRLYLEKANRYIPKPVDLGYIKILVRNLIKA